MEDLIILKVTEDIEIEEEYFVDVTVNKNKPRVRKKDVKPVAKS